MEGARLEELAHHRPLVRLRRKVGGLPPVVGIVLRVSPAFVLLREVHGGRLGGFSVLRRDSVESVRWDWMMRRLARLAHVAPPDADVGPPFDVDLRDWPRLFRSLERAGIAITAEDEHPRRFHYTTGHIVHVNGLAVGIRWPRPVPPPAPDTDRTPYERITRVTFV